MSLDVLQSESRKGVLSKRKRSLYCKSVAEQKPGFPPSCNPRGNAILIPAIMSAEQNPPTIDARVLESTIDIQVFNSEGGMVRFGEIFADQKTIVVFIRAYTSPICSYVFH